MQWEMALALLSEMTAMKLQANEINFNAALAACAATWQCM